MPKFRKKPVVIEAIKWTGENFREVHALSPNDTYLINDSLLISTLEGAMHASVGDYIIKGLKGEVYPCKPDIFEASYDSVE